MKKKFGIWSTNKFGKRRSKKNKNVKGLCIKCGAKVKNHHWLCDPCWNEENIKDGGYIKK